VKKTTNYVLALDQGTTSSRAVVYDAKGRVAGMAQKEFTQLFPKPGWVEHKPEEIWSSQAAVMAEVMASTAIKPRQLSAVGITNQRETTVVWERKSGKPIYNAIVWQDRRTAEFMDQLRAEGMADMIFSKTGLVPDAYFSASKIKWILDNVSGAREKAEKGKLAFGTVDSWLMWKLTEGEVHATDPSNASRTMLFNIHTCKWDDDLLNMFGIHPSLLPEVKSSSEIFGVVSKRISPAPVPIAGVAGDQQASLFGQRCTQSGMAKTTYGTGCFLMMNTGAEPVASSNQLLSTIAWKVGGKVSYALEGSVFIGGAAIQWLRDGLGLLSKSGHSEKLAARLKSSEGVYFVPALTGLGAPHWDPDARGAIFGITRSTTKAHIVRAALEAIAFQVKDVVDAMARDTGQSLKEMRVDGGAAENNFLMQFQSDTLRTKILRPKNSETTSLGAAFLAGLAVGTWKSEEELDKLVKIDSEFEPIRSKDEMSAALHGWQKAVSRSLRWIDTTKE
jgi:glycerol kinase